METVADIMKLKERYIALYGLTRQYQLIDQTYRDDTFPVPEIKSPHKIWRSGVGSRMVDAPAEQIVTSNPQVFFDIIKGNKEIATHLSKEVNENWVELLKQSNPNYFKESVKNKLSRGESYVKVVHNEKWMRNPKGKDKDGLPIFDRRGMPVIFGVPDPMVIYGSPEEDDCGWIPNIGIPNRVLMIYPRQPAELLARYPSYKNKAGKKKDTEWVEYWDKDTMYYAADDEVIVHTKNPYKVTPFVRKYSGFGRRAPDGELANLIVSDIRFSKDLIKQECMTRSNIIEIERLFAHSPKIISQSGLANPLNEKDFKDFSWGEYDINVLPPGSKLEDFEALSVPPEMYQNHAKVMTELMQRNPFLAAGSPFAPSAREGDRSFTAAMRRYDSIVESTESEWATATALALIICRVMPGLKPDGLNEEDLNATYKVSMKLRSEDPIEHDNLVTLGERLRNSERPAIDLSTFHTEFLGWTQAKSEKVQVGILAEQVTFNNPAWVQAVGGIAVK